MPKSVDLSDYYVNKKQNHGWTLTHIVTGTSIYIDRYKLVELGLLLDDSVNDKEICHTRKSEPRAIVVPLGRQRSDCDHWRK